MTGGEDPRKQSADTQSEAKQVQAFLDELTEVSRRHGITIGGCGCCGSPTLALRGAFNPEGAKAPHAIETEGTRAGGYIVVRERYHDYREADGYRYEDLKWRPAGTAVDTIDREHRAGLEGAPSVLPSIDELEGIQHALLAPDRHQFTDTEIAELESEHYRDQFGRDTALKAAYRQQDPNGYQRSLEGEEPDPMWNASDEEVEAQISRAEATLRERPKDYFARQARLTAWREIRSRSRRTRKDPERARNADAKRSDAEHARAG